MVLAPMLVPTTVTSCTTACVMLEITYTGCYPQLCAHACKMSVQDLADNKLLCTQIKCCRWLMKANMSRIGWGYTVSKGEYLKFQSLQEVMQVCRQTCHSMSLQCSITELIAAPD